MVGLESKAYIIQGRKIHLRYDEWNFQGKKLPVANWPWPALLSYALFI